MTRPLHECNPRVIHPKDRKSTRLNSSHSQISYAVFCLKKKKKKYQHQNSELLPESNLRGSVTNGYNEPTCQIRPEQLYRMRDACHGLIRNHYRVIAATARSSV